MFKLACSMALFLISQLSAAHNTIKGGNVINNNQTQHSGYKMLDTQQLVDAKKNIPDLILVDSRTKQYDDGKRIKGAIYLPADAEDAEIQKALPKRNQPIAIYCWSTACPASTWLVDRLVKMGYTNLYKYPDGLVIWIEKGLPIDAVSNKR